MTKIRTFVTGAAGFIGSHLCGALLDRGDVVVGLDNFDPFYPRRLKERNLAPLTARGLAFNEVDLRDAESLRGVMVEAKPDRIFHLAALAGVRPSMQRPAAYAEVNVTGTVHLLEAARSAGVRDVVFASSSSVYGNCSAVPFRETDACTEPISPYAATKRSGELLCGTWAQLFGMSIGSLRFFTVYGPAQRPDLAIAQFLARVSAGDPITLFGDGTTSRDYTYVDDVIRGVLAAGEVVAGAAAGSHRIWNLGGSRPVSLLDLVRKIEVVVGRSAEITWAPPQMGDVDRTCADTTRSHAELGFTPRVVLEEGLARQWTWYRQQR